MFLKPADNQPSFLLCNPVISRDFGVVLICFSISVFPVVKATTGYACFGEQPGKWKVRLLLNLHEVIDYPIANIQLNPAF